MDVQWQLPHGFSAGPLRYPVPTRLTVAGLMNYVYERDYAVLVRLKVPAGARGIVADPRRSALARLHRQGLRARAGASSRSTCRSAAERPTARSSTSGGGRCRGRWPAPAHFAVDGDKLRVAIPLPASVDGRASPIFFPITDGAGRLCRAAGLPPRRRHADRRARGARASPQQFAGVLALGDGRGLEFRARAGPGAGRRHADRRAGRRSRACGRCSARSPAGCCST